MASLPNQTEGGKRDPQLALAEAFLANPKCLAEYDECPDKDDGIETSKELRSQRAAEIISRQLRREWAEHLAEPANWKKVPSARQLAGHFLGESHPLAAWRREAPKTSESHIGYWGDVRDWLLRAAGHLQDVTEQWRTDREAEAMLRDALQEGGAR